MAAGISVILYRYPNLCIWLAQAILVLGLAFINPNHYTTTDSGYYLQSAQHLMEGKGYRVVENGRLEWNSTFPAGYPLLIAGISLLSGLPVLWASKIVNLAASGLLIALFCRWYGSKRAVLLGGILLTGPFLRLWAHTWSEPVFLLLLSCWAYLATSDNRRPGWLAAAGTSLLLVRYAGIFIVPAALVSAFRLYRARRRPDAARMWILAGCWLAIFLCYGGLNRHFGENWYGGPRFFQPDALPEILGMFGRGLFNELLLIRDMYPGHSFLPSLPGMILQAVLLWKILQRLKEQGPAFRPDERTAGFIWIAGSYLLFLLAVRAVSPFDPPGYRLLSPFTFITLQALILSLDNEDLPLSVKKYLLVLVALSWLDLVPHDGLLQKLETGWEGLRR